MGQCVAKEDDMMTSLHHDTKRNIAHALWQTDFDVKKLSKSQRDAIFGSENSPKKFAMRKSGQLQNYLLNPVFLNPDYKQRYNILLQPCSTDITPQQSYAITSCLGLDSVTGYEPIPIPSGIQLPKDDAPQWRNQVGWHFFVGNCVSDDGAEYCVEMMFWRIALLPPNMATIAGLNEIENQIVVLHLAIGDKEKGISYRAEPTIIAGTTGLIEFTSYPFHYKMGHNSMQSLSVDTTFPIRLQAKGYGKIGEGQNEEDIDIQVDLNLVAMKDYFMQGEGGCSPSVDGIGTLYYSVSNLQFVKDSDNYLFINSEKIKLSKGKLWYDHQWTAGFFPPGNPQNSVLRAALNKDAYNKKTNSPGWDWFMVQFEDDVEMTFAAPHTLANKNFYERTGTKPGEMKADIIGKFIDKRSAATNIGGSMVVTDWCRSVTSPNPQMYPPTDTWYPNRFEITITTEATNPVPEKYRVFTVVPIIDGQTGFFGNGLQYSESGATIFDKGGQRIGTGFAEATAYANTWKNVLKLAGVPSNDENINKIFPTAPVSESLFLEGIAYLALPGKEEELLHILGEAKGLTTKINHSD